MLTRHEVSRILGTRAAQLSEGATPRVATAPWQSNNLYIAALELDAGAIDAQVKRKDEWVHVRDLHSPPLLTVLLNNEDGGARPFRTKPLTHAGTPRS